MKSGCVATRSAVGSSAYQTQVCRAYLPGFARTFTSLDWFQSSDHGVASISAEVVVADAAAPEDPSVELGMLATIDLDCTDGTHNRLCCCSVKMGVVLTFGRALMCGKRRPPAPTPRRAPFSLRKKCFCVNVNNFLTPC